MEKRFTIGSDPEFFVKSLDSGVIPSLGLFGGTKEEPKPTPELGDGFFVQEDNVAVEFNIPPCETKEDFINSIANIVDNSKLIMPKNVELMIASSYFFKPEQLLDPALCEFGCSPDINAWTYMENEPPCATDATLRSCGGHVAVGNKEFDNFQLARAMDISLGLPSVFMDKDKDRRQLYGKAGSFRNTPFGIEYRSLSNFWTATKELTGFIYDGVERALQIMDELEGYVPEDYGAKIQEAINNSNVAVATELCEEFNITHHKHLI